MDEVRTRPSGAYAKTHCDLYLGGRGRRASRPPGYNNMLLEIDYDLKTTTTAHCSVPMLKYWSDEAGPSP